MSRSSDGTELVAIVNPDGSTIGVGGVISTNTTIGTTGTATQVASSATSVTLLAANSSRKEAIIFNDSTSVLYVKFGITASSTSYTVQVQPGDSWIEDRYAGRIDGIWTSANGNAYVTEVA